jgi:hypothetical protein
MFRPRGPRVAGIPDSHYLLLERIHHDMATTRDFARIAIIQPELVEGRAMCLSEAGKNKLQSSPREGPQPPTKNRAQPTRKSGANSKRRKPGLINDRPEERKKAEPMAPPFIIWLRPA